MDAPTLYTFRRCPFAIRARLAIAAAQVEVRAVEVHLANKPSEMLRLSPKGTVPVLHLGGGMVLDESLEIMKWALAQRDPLHWLRGCDQPAFADIIAENDDSFKKQLDRYKYPQRYALPDGAEARKAAGTILYAWEQRLRAHDHLLSQAPTMVDAAIFPFVRQFAAVDSPWFAQAFPALERWRERWDSSSLMQRVMVKI